jgi:hypothetical protein
LNVAARLYPLHDQRIGTSTRGGGCFVGGADLHEHEGAGVSRQTNQRLIDPP